MCISTTATNTGLAPVTVASCTMLVHGHGGSRVAVVDWVSQSPTSLPARLEPGDHWTGMAHAASMKASLDHNLGARQRWLIRPIVGDPTGRAYKAKARCAGGGSASGCANDTVWFSPERHAAPGG